jgi:hypothetical protein
VKKQSKVYFTQHDPKINSKSFFEIFPVPRVVKSNLITIVKDDPCWYTRPRYNVPQKIMEQFDMSLLDIKKFCGESKLKKYIIAHNLKPIESLFDAFSKYQINEGVWCYEGLTDTFMFGDLNQNPYTCVGLINFLHDVKLFSETTFYEWSQPTKPYWVSIKDEKINFHRRFVWITRIPKVFQSINDKFI